MYLVEDGELVHVVRVPRAVGKVGAGLRVGEMEGNAFLASRFTQSVRGWNGEHLKVSTNRYLHSQLLAVRCLLSLLHTVGQLQGVTQRPRRPSQFRLARLDLQ